MLERLQKVLAEGGIGSRRDCEILISEGRVEVDRQIVTKLGTKVDVEVNNIRVDGVALKIAPKKYFLVNKPRGVVSTNSDPSGRTRVVDLVSTDQHIYTVGRLDKDSEGMIIVTNDGDLANRLTHPKYGVEKTYLIQVEGHPTREQMESLQAGVYIAEGVAQVKRFQFKRKQKHTTDIEVVLDEGRNREVRRLLAKIGHKVLTLKRIAIGSLIMSGVRPGGTRLLKATEVKQLFKNPKLKKKQQAPKKPGRKVQVAELTKVETEDDEKRPGAHGRDRKSGYGKKRVSKRYSSSRESTGHRGKSTGKKVTRKSSGGKKSSRKKVAGKSSSNRKPSESSAQDNIGRRGRKKTTRSKTTGSKASGSKKSSGGAKKRGVKKSSSGKRSSIKPTSRKKRR